MLDDFAGKKQKKSLQEMVKLYLALPGYSNQFFFFQLIFYSLVCGILGAMGTFASLILVRPFSLLVFLVSFWLLLVTPNILVYLLLSRRALKQPQLKISDYTSGQKISALFRMIGLVVCPLLLTIVGLLQISKGLWDDPLKKDHLVSIKED